MGAVMTNEMAAFRSRHDRDCDDDRVRSHKGRNQPLKSALTPQLAIVFAGLLLSLCGLVHAATYQSHTNHKSNVLRIVDNERNVTTLTFHNEGAVEVHVQPPALPQPRSYALDVEVPDPLPTTLKDSPATLVFGTAQLTAEVQKSPLRIRFLRGREVLIEEELGHFVHETLRGFRFRLSPGEKLMGGGARVLGMDRRGQRLPLYNRAHYGYSTESNQMSYGLPAVLSNKRYALVFDNAARGNLDIGKTESDILHVDAVAGRLAYVVVAGDSYPDLVEHFTDATGRQPLPPRWAFGNFASRFGYRSEQEVRDTVALFQKEKIPLDAVVIDIYWFGKDIQGHMGNLDWDRATFPNAEKMIADLSAQGIKTVLVTEPFVLTTSKRWQEAVAADILAKNVAGQPRRYDFYFGNTGLIDVFKPEAQTWFWGVYDGLIRQGVAGHWGDLGEPEVHPDDTIHINGTAEEVHNAFGHQWARLLYDNHVATYPDRRPFILMRSGTVGSQRYGMIPWTGDIERSWGGLKPQVELSLQMGMLGVGYMHSDLGGFAGGEKFDRELYTRWLQYGVFQPIYRPHAQDHIASEPVFHDKKTRALAREAIELRYRLLPYIYTLAYENATRGAPLMRPLAYLDESDPKLFDRKDAYLWGDAFLVAPLTDPKQKSITLDVPKGQWYDFFDPAEQFSGGQAHKMKVRPNHVPVLVKAGAFVPLAPVATHTDSYRTETLDLHYYAGAAQATGQMYDDDGRTRTAIESGQHELLRYTASETQGGYAFTFARTGRFIGQPAERRIRLRLFGASSRLASVEVDGAVRPVSRDTESAYVDVVVR